MNKLAWVVVLVVVVAGVFMLSKKSEPTETGSIKIGVIGPLTGDAASYGEVNRNSTMIAVDEINTAGGINGRLIEVIYEDGKCTGAPSSSAAQKLVSVDKVQIVTAACSGENLAALPVTEVAEVVLASAWASSPDLTGKSALYFRNYPSDAAQGRVLAEYAGSQNWKKVAMIQEQTEYAAGNYKAFNENFVKLGGTVVKEEFPSMTTDFRSILSKLKAENPDALFINTQTAASAQKVIKQMIDLGWKPKILGNDLIANDATLVLENKEALEGTITAAFGVDPTNEKFNRFITSYKERFGKEPEYQSYAQTAYDLVYLIAEGVKEVGYNGEKIAAWARTVKDWQGASGLITIGADGDRTSAHSLRIIKNGKAEVLK